MKELICIVCPKGCRLKVDEQNGYAVTGNGCERGAAYGYKELTNPTRVLTTTVRITNAAHRRLPVKTDRDIPQGLLAQCVKELSQVTMVSPVRRGDVVYRDILGTGANVVAARDL